MIDNSDEPQGGHTTGLLLMLPFMEEAALHSAYNFKTNQPPIVPVPLTNETDLVPTVPYASNINGPTWFNMANTTVVSKQVAVLFCPSNRNEGQVQAGNDQQWLVGGTDYGFNNGAVAALCSNPGGINYMGNLAGPFGVNTKTRIKDLVDGTSNTIMMGEISGGELFVATRDTTLFLPPDSTAIDGRASTADPRPWGVDQGWAMAWAQKTQGEAQGGPRGSIFFSSYQHLGSNAKMDGLLTTGAWGIEDLPARMSPRLVRQAAVGLTTNPMAQTSLSNNQSCISGDARLPEARCQHSGIVQFLFGDGTVKTVKTSIDDRVYGKLTTMKGQDIVDEDDY
jgi:hypothetical protein